MGTHESPYMDVPVFAPGAGATYAMASSHEEPDYALANAGGDGGYMDLQGLPPLTHNYDVASPDEDTAEDGGYVAVNGVGPGVVGSGAGVAGHSGDVGYVEFAGHADDVGYVEFAGHGTASSSS